MDSDELLVLVRERIAELGVRGLEGVLLLGFGIFGLKLFQRS
jgi:hypothetical protein